MFKVLLLFLAVVFCVAQAQPGPTPTWSWAGNTFNSSTNFTHPYYSFGEKGGRTDACDWESSVSYYTLVNFTVTTAGVYNFVALGDYENDFNLYVYLYQGSYNPTNSCANYVKELDREVYQLDSNAPEVNDFVYLTAGIYFLVATGDDFEYYGNFAINVFAPTITGDNFGSTAQWNYTQYDYSQTGSAGCSVYEAGYTAPYVRFAWNQATAGTFDLVVGWDRNYTEVPDYMVAILYQGNVTDADLQGEDPCNPASGTVIIGQQGSGGYSGSTIFGVSLTAGQVYTLVFSGDEPTDFGRWGIFVQTTRVWTFHTSVLWTPPGSGGGLFGFYSSCPASDSSDTYPWVATSWKNSVGEITLISLSDYGSIAGWSGEPSWTYTYVYTGENDGSAVTSPSTCPTPLVSSFSFVGGWDEYVPGLVYPINTTLSLVVQDWDSDSVSDPKTAVIAYILTGVPVGFRNSSALPSTTSTTSSATTSSATTSSSTTSSPTTSSPTTSTPTTAASTSSNSSATTTPSSSSSSSSTTSSPIVTTGTSGASIVSASFVVLLSVFALLF